MAGSWDGNQARFMLRVAGSAFCAVLLFTLAAFSQTTSTAQLKVLETQLSHDGELCGTLMDQQGQPLANVTLMIWDRDRLVGQTTTNHLGEFRTSLQRTGVYVLTAGKAAYICRTWPPNTPFAGKGQLLLVSDEMVVRGSHFTRETFYDWFERHPILGYFVAAVAIVVPLVVFTQDDDD